MPKIDFPDPPFLAVLDFFTFFLFPFSLLFRQGSPTNPWNKKAITPQRQGKSLKEKGKEIPKSKEGGIRVQRFGMEGGAKKQLKSRHFGRFRLKAFGGPFLSQGVTNGVF